VVVAVQVVVNYDAMTPAGRVFDSSVEKGKPYDIRVGSGQVWRQGHGHKGWVIRTLTTRKLLFFVSQQNAFAVIRWSK
jgi:hypothetical protein